MKALPIVPDSGFDLKLRAHTLLCLQGFRGLGYNPTFIDNLTRIHNDLVRNEHLIVQVLDTPDAVCGACPHHAESAGCTLNGPDGEVMIQSQDREILTRLGLRAGAQMTWREILDRIRTAIHEDELPKICGKCRWLSLGYCRNGIARLHERP